MAQRDNMMEIMEESLGDMRNKVGRCNRFKLSSKWKGKEDDKEAIFEELING